ncbi:MAG: hypothetical protein AAFQ50_07150, partial [Pseudomonadota bacterium]
MMFRVLTLTLAFLALALPLRADPNLKVALAQLRANDPGAARAAMARVDDPVLRDVVMWHLLRGRHGTFPEAVAFLERNADWPGLPPQKVPHHHVTQHRVVDPCPWHGS